MEVLAEFSYGLALVRFGDRHDPRATPAGSTAGELLPRLAKALARPGLPRKSVFTGGDGVFAYSIDPDDPTLLIQESADGRRVRGRIRDGCFVASAGMRAA